MPDGKLLTNQRYTVLLSQEDNSNVPALGKLYTDITVKYMHVNDVSLTTATVLEADWVEVGERKYTLLLGGTEWSQLGQYQVSVTCTGVIPYEFPVFVSAYSMEEIYTMINSINTRLPSDPADASDISTSFGTVNSSLSTILNETQSHPTLAEMEASTVLAKEATVNALPTLAEMEASTLAKVNSQMDLVNSPNINALNAIADATLKRDWSVVVGEASRSLINALRKFRNKYSISGPTGIITKEDDITPAYTETLTTNVSAVPITGWDPT